MFYKISLDSEEENSEFLEALPFGNASTYGKI
jgi:hypothetical protein